MGMQAVILKQYIRALPPHVTEKPIESPLVEVEEIDAGSVFTTATFKVIAGEVEHHQRVGTPSIGFRVETAYGVVAISGDTRPCQGMIDLARGADLLIHDAAFLDSHSCRRSRACSGRSPRTTSA